MNQLQAEPRVQKVIVLNLRFDAEPSHPGAADQQVQGHQPTASTLAARPAGTLLEDGPGQLRPGQDGWFCSAAPTTAASRTTRSSPARARVPACWPAGEGARSTPRCQARRPHRATPPRAAGAGSNAHRRRPYVGPRRPYPAHRRRRPLQGRSRPLRARHTRGGRRHPHQPSRCGTGQIRRIQVAGVGNGVTDIPANATAVALNVTATRCVRRRLPHGLPVRPGHTAERLERQLRPRPDRAQRRHRAGRQPRAHLRLELVAQTDLIVDINGYYNDQGSSHTSQDPAAARRHPARAERRSVNPATPIGRLDPPGQPGPAPLASPSACTTAVALNVTAVAARQRPAS